MLWLVFKIVSSLVNFLSGVTTEGVWAAAE